MKCPLLLAGLWANPNEEIDPETKCQEEECAWWDKECDECCIKSLIDVIGSLGVQLVKIRDTMPHAGKRE